MGNRGKPRGVPNTVADQLGRPVNTVYKALQRVRRALRECVDRRVNAQA